MKYEDDPPLTPPPALPAGYDPAADQDTVRPPPPIDFSKLNDSEKLDWACSTLVHVANGVSDLNHRFKVLQNLVGAPREHEAPPLWTLVEQMATGVQALSVDVEGLRKDLLGKGASVIDLAHAKSRIAARPPDDSNL